jgi:predicted Zn-dependent peptidase
MSENYATDEMVISSVGNIPFDSLVRLTERYFGEAEPKSRKRLRVKPNSYEPKHIQSIKNTHQIHCMLGNTAYDASSEKRYSLALLNNILGGPGMNSRLNIALREKTGIAYNVESHYTAYSDTGILMIYFACDKDKFPKSLKLVQKELSVLKEKRLGTLQMSKAKKQLLGQIAVSSDNNEHLMLSIGKNMLLYNRVESLPEIKNHIEEVSSQDIIEAANTIFETGSMTSLEYH